MNPKNSQDEDAGHESEEEKTGDLSEERNGEAEGVKDYGAPESKEE